LKSKRLNFIFLLITFIVMAYLVFTRVGFIYGILSIILMIIYFIVSNRYIYYILKANLAAKTNDNKIILNYFEKAYKCKGCPNGTKISYSFLLLKNGRVDEAFKLLNELKINTFEKTERARVDMNLSIAYYLKGDLTKAISILENLKESFKNSVLYGNLGALYIDERDYNKALKFCEEAYEYNDKDIGIVDNLATVHLELKNYEKSEKYFIELMELNPKDPNCYFSFGRLEEELGNKDKALELYETSLKKEPNFFSKFNREEALNRIKSITVNNE